MKALAVIVGALIVAGTIERADAEQRTAAPTWLQAKVTTLRAERAVLRRENRRLRRVLAHKPSVREAIRLAAITYNVPAAEIRAVAWCESRLDPRADNPTSTASGVLQLLTSTFAATPFRNESIYSPYANVLAGTWIRHNDGHWGQWVCKP